MSFELTLTVVDPALLEPSAPPLDFPVYFVFVKLYLSLQCRKTLEEVRRKSIFLLQLTTSYPEVFAGRLSVRASGIYMSVTERK